MVSTQTDWIPVMDLVSKIRVSEIERFQEKYPNFAKLIQLKKREELLCIPTKKSLVFQALWNSISDSTDVEY